MLDRSFLRARAGARSYERGLGYFEAGCVEKVVLEGELLLATVQGTQRYRVELRPGEGSLEHSCSCPCGRDGAFCKHCVAAGLAFLEAGADPPEPWPEPLSLDAIRERLEDLDREALQSLLLEQARADERVLERLRLWFAADSERVDLESFRRAIELAVDPGDFVSYHEAYDWSRGIDEVIDAVEGLLEDGHAGAVIELSEHVLAALAGLGGLIDDSSGHVTLLCERLERLHLTACERARPDPEELAERLLRWQLDCELEVFYDTADAYADVLGEAGLQRYAELARADWEQVPERGPGDQREYGRRFRITKVMEDLAGDDVDELAAVMRRDLSLPHDFLRIAEVYRQADRDEEAIEWAERGLEAFPDERADSRLQTFLAELYAARGRHAEALEIAWDRFADHPGLDSYRELKPYAERVAEWPRRRDRALGLLRKRAKAVREEARRRGYGGLWGGDHSQLVRILLWEGDVEEAWREAEAGGCDESLWLELAGRRKETHPEDALRVYHDRIEPTIARKTKADYEDAVGLIEEVGGLLWRLGREHELSALVGEIRATHARKRNLVALLDRIRLDATTTPSG